VMKEIEAKIHEAVGLERRPGDQGPAVETPAQEPKPEAEAAPERRAA
jgi:hypothetical protein